MDEYVCLTELAIRLYNIKEVCFSGSRQAIDATICLNFRFPINSCSVCYLTNYFYIQHTQFILVKLLKIVTAKGGCWINLITFEALSPRGDATVFKTTITQFFLKYKKIEIKSVELKSSQSGHNGEKSKQDPPLDIAQQPVIKTFPAVYFCIPFSYASGILFPLCALVLVILILFIYIEFPHCRTLWKIWPLFSPSMLLSIMTWTRSVSYLFIFLLINILKY